MPNSLLSKPQTLIRTKKAHKQPLFHVMTVSSLTKRNFSEHIFQAIEAMCEMNFLVSVIAEGDEEAQEHCFKLVEKYPNNFTIHEATDKNRLNLMQKAHVVLIPNKPKKSLKEEVISHKIIPILPENCGFDNFNAQQEKGTGFTFQKGNFWQMLCAVMKASENQKFTYDWKVLQKNLSRLRKI